MGNITGGNNPAKSSFRARQRGFVPGSRTLTRPKKGSSQGSKAKNRKRRQDSS